MGKVPVSAQKNTSAAKLLYALPLLVVCAVFLLAPAFFSALCTKASCDWVSGWSAWKRGDAAAALYCWSRHPFCARFAPRPARFCYWRARALDRLGRGREAQAMRSAAARKFPFDFYVFLMFKNGGSQLGVNNDARRTAALFNPRPWLAQTEAASRRTGVGAHLLWSLMKRESKFNPQAVSRNGAVGLMQLMPDTAAEDARSLGVDPGGVREPGLNILLGAKHFAMLDKKFAGELPRAIAAYNAGGAPVERWGAPADGDWAAWTEDIPYAETREFVRSVLENAEIYRLVYGAPAGTEPLSQLASKDMPGSLQ